VLVAFMPWRGYNFEDAILISEKLVREDYYNLGPHRRVRDRGAATRSWDLKRYARHSQRERACAARSGRERRDPHRRQIKARRHSCRQGDAEGRNATDGPEEKLLRAIFGERPAMCATLR